MYVSPEGDADADDIRAALLSMDRGGAQTAAMPPTDGASPTQWVLLLRPGCFDGDAGETFARRVETALRAGVRLVVVYVPEVAAFGDLMSATPDALHELGLFGPLAIEWRRGAYSTVSANLLALALGAQMDRTCCWALGSVLDGGCQWAWARRWWSGEGQEGLISRGGRRIERDEVALSSVLSSKVDGHNAWVELQPGRTVP